LVDTLKEENLDEEFAELNPNQTIPLIKDGDTKIISEAKPLYLYLMNRF